jgi:hypothetical protein
MYRWCTFYTSARPGWLNYRTRAICRPTHQLSTINQHTFTHRVSFVYLWHCTSCNLSCKVSLLYTSLMADMNSFCHIFFFQSRSICDRSTSIGAKCLWEWGSEPIKRFWWYSRFRDGRELVEYDERDGRPNLTRTDVNIASVADLVKNDRRIASSMIADSLNIIKTSFSDSESGFGKEKVVFTFCSTPLDIWAKERSSHILPRDYRDGRCRQIIF